LYMILFYFNGVLPVNIDYLLLFLEGTTEFGIGLSTALFYMVSIVSSLIFGYYCDKISEKIPRKRLFFFTNAVWLVSYGLISFSLNYIFYLIFILLAAIGHGAFLPIGYSIIGDFFPPKERAKKFGMMQVGLTLGVGFGIIIGGSLGTYLGTGGWRYSYGFGFMLGLLPLIYYGLRGIDPQRGGSEPEFKEIKGLINYDYKITLSNLFQLFKKKSIFSVLFYVLCQGVAISTIGTWGIFYLTKRISGGETKLLAILLTILTGVGSLPGVIIGGKLGDKYYEMGKVKGRVMVSFIGVLFGSLCLLGFYLLPFLTRNMIEVVLSWILFLILGFMGYFFINLPIGNQFAIYSEVSAPEVRNTANALNGVMVNIGAIIGNLVLSSLIEQNMSLLPLSLFLLLLIMLVGATFWIIAYFYYPKEAKEFRDLMRKRRLEIEEKTR
ncbi:MAG: MFS transporter, partial [Candidatus Hermodarchaeota archaeon]